MRGPKTAAHGQIALCFGENVGRCRRRVGLSQEEVAVLASLHRTEVSNLERGLRVPRLDTLVKLMSVLEASPDDLLEGIHWVPGQLSQGGFSLSRCQPPAKRGHISSGR
jgi:transcriptional regulator with XRE-family HTH domain